MFRHGRLPTHLNSRDSWPPVSRFGCQFVRAYLALCRFPAVFTALADIGLGYAIVAGPRFTPRFALTLLASAGLYLGGMVLNDILDEAKDTLERPQRPIPSGRVSRAAAWRFYAVLTLGGLAAAAACVNMLSLAVAVALAITVWLYDGPLKRTLLGPFVMGACRSGNILLGASAGLGTLASITDTKVLWISAAMGVYICGLTWFARNEAGTPRRPVLLFGWLLINAGLAAAVAWAGWHQAEDAGPRMILPLILLVLIINFRLSNAIVEPLPARVQAAIKTMLLAIPIWNATLVAVVLGPQCIVWAAGMALLVVPAAFIGRFLKLT